MAKINARLDHLEARALARVLQAPDDESADRLVERLRRLAMTGHAYGDDGSPACRVAMLIFDAAGESTEESLSAGLEALREYAAR